MIFSMIPMGAFATTVEDEAVVETVVETQSVAEVAEVQEETTSSTENETERTAPALTDVGEEATTVVLQDGVTATVTVPAGGVAYIEVDATAGDMTLTVNGNRMYYDWYVQAGVQQYAPYASGATEIALPAGTVYTLPIYNTSADSEAVLEVTASSPVVGTVDNPVWLVMGDNVATCTAGGQAYYFTWTAEQDGTLVLTMPEGDWMYAVNNLTTTVYGDTQFSDSDPVVNPAVVDVAAGDVLQIYVNTYNPADMWSNPAGDLVVTASFQTAVNEDNAASVMTQEEFLAEIEQAKADGYSYYTLDRELILTSDLTIGGMDGLSVDYGGSLTIPDGVTLTLHGVYLSLYGDSSLTVKSGGTLTIRNTGMQVDNATLTVEEGGVLNHNKSLYINVQYATVNGVAKSDIGINAFVTTLDEVEQYIDIGAEYRCVELILESSMTLDRDLTIPSGAIVNIQQRDGSETLTVPAGYTLTNYGDIDIFAGGELLVEEGG